jgi:Thoeris protein ThsB, TIR-like domain
MWSLAQRPGDYGTPTHVTQEQLCRAASAFLVESFNERGLEMGGGGGGGPSYSDLKRLEDLAKRRLRDSDVGRRNVFISFVNEDRHMVELLRGQAKNEDSALDFNDWSLQEPFDSERSEYVRQGIRERIRQASVTLVYLSDRTADSKWVNWEIEESVRLGKKVIGVYQGHLPAKLPAAVWEHGIRVVPWTHEGIARELQ